MKLLRNGIACMGALVLSQAALADLTIDLGGGWEATVSNPDVVDLVTDYVSLDDDILVIEKFAIFQEIDPFTGQPVPINIAFNQIASDANTVSQIVITDELVFNDTGLDWTGFRNVLALGGATFNVADSADFSIDPFTTTSYSDDLTEVMYGGGVLAAGENWTPGLQSGGLVIDVDLSGDAPAKFILKEIAVTIPAPAALAVLGLGLATTRRRRRA